MEGKIEFSVNSGENKMEAFEHVAKVWLETAENCVVSSGVKFPVRLKTKKSSRDEFQEHGYEIDLVAARRDRLLLVSVKSFFGSKGLSLEGLKKESLFGRQDVMEGVLSGAEERYGYSRAHIEICSSWDDFSPVTKELSHSTSIT
jgi:hypothetical protein